MSDRNKAFELQERLEVNGVSHASLLGFLMNDYFSGSAVLGAMQSALIEFGLEEDEDEDEDDE